MIEIKINNNDVLNAFNRLLQLGNDLSPVMTIIAGKLKDQTKTNFATESGPLGKWPDRKDKKRIGPILRDKGRLADNIFEGSDANSAWIGTNTVYAAIHQFGGAINKPAQSRLVRHRTDRKGNLMTSEHFGGKGLIFAKNSHKNAVQRWFEQGAHDINMPARPFLPVTPDGRLQDGMEEQIVEVIRAALQKAIAR
jgi:phage virion morphogenesis protein